MEIILNGQKEVLDDVSTLFDIINAKGVSPEAIVAMVDGVIYKAGDFANVEISPGSRVEILHFVGGG